MHKSDLFGEVENGLRDYLKRDKLELIWIIAVLIIIKEGRRKTETEEYLRQIQQYMKLI